MSINLKKQGNQVDAVHKKLSKRDASLGLLNNSIVIQESNDEPLKEGKESVETTLIRYKVAIEKLDEEQIRLKDQMKKAFDKVKQELLKI